MEEVQKFRPSYIFKNFILRYITRVADIFAACFVLISCMANSSSLKMEAIRSSETSVNFHRTTWRYIPEGRSLHNYRCENLKFNSYILFCFVSGKRKQVCLTGKDTKWLNCCIRKRVSRWHLTLWTIINTIWQADVQYFMLQHNWWIFLHDVQVCGVPLLKYCW
jgi:hypothetical protein